MTKNYYNISPQIYDDQFWWKKDDIEFWKKLFQSKKNTILELAAGTGRLALPLIREGYNYKGIELSASYSKHANRKINELSGSDNIEVNDMKTFNLNCIFNDIFIGFNSWLHLLNISDATQCLKSVKKHMNRKSRFYIDVFVPNPLFLYRLEDLAIRVLEFRDSVTNQMMYIDEILFYDKKNETADITWIYSNAKKRILYEFNFQMKMYYPDTMHSLLIDNGFQIKNVWGSYNQDDFTESSTLQIYQCTLQ